MKVELIFIYARNHYRNYYRRHHAFFSSLHNNKSFARIIIIIKSTHTDLRAATNKPKQKPRKIKIVQHAPNINRNYNDTII